MDVKKRIALRIRSIRKRRGLSQEEVAGLIDALAQGLKVPLSDFFLDEKTESPVRAEAMARLTDAARQLDDRMLKAAAAIVEVLATGEK